MSARGRWKCVAVAWVAFTVCAPAFAQEITRPDAFRDMPSQVLKHLAREVQLTEAQQDQLAALKKRFETKHQGELRSLRRDVRRVGQELRAARQSGDAPALRKAQAEARSLRQAGERLRHEFDAQVKPILTEAQRKRYAEVQAAAAARSPGASGKTTLGSNPR